MLLWTAANRCALLLCLAHARSTHTRTHTFLPTHCAHYPRTCARLCARCGGPSVHFAQGGSRCSRVFLCPLCLRCTALHCRCTPLYTRILSLYAENNDLEIAVPGGLIGIGTQIDPTLTRADRLVGQVRLRLLWKGMGCL